MAAKIEAVGNDVILNTVTWRNQLLTNSKLTKQPYPIMLAYQYATENDKAISDKWKGQKGVVAPLGFKTPPRYV